jgi:hypothetical protein
MPPAFGWAQAPAACSQNKATIAQTPPVNRTAAGRPLVKRRPGAIFDAGGMPPVWGPDPPCPPASAAG